MAIKDEIKNGYKGWLVAAIVGMMSLYSLSLFGVVKLHFTLPFENKKINDSQTEQLKENCIDIYKVQEELKLKATNTYVNNVNKEAINEMKELIQPMNRDLRMVIKFLIDNNKLVDEVVNQKDYEITINTL